QSTPLITNRSQPLLIGENCQRTCSFRLCSKLGSVAQLAGQRCKNIPGAQLFAVQANTVNQCLCLPTMQCSAKLFGEFSKGQCVNRLRSNIKNRWHGKETVSQSGSPFGGQLHSRLG